MIPGGKKRALTLKSSFNLIKAEIESVEKTLTRLTNDFDPGVAPYISYVCETEGKRIRPALTFLVGGAISDLTQRHINLASTLELIHIASLVHDDIIDGAAERRSVATVNAKWGEGIAVLLGDALFSHAMMLATEFEDVFLAKEISMAARDVCQGEILQSQRRFDLSMTEEEYFKLLEMKTGALFGAATGLSAYISGADPEEVQALQKFGLDLGIAYQIYDDCLDMIGSEQDSGKTLGTDSEKGKMTLPLLYLLKSSSPTKKQQLREVISNHQSLDLPGIVGEEAYIEANYKALNYALTLLEGCKATVQALPNKKYREALTSVCFYIENLFLELKQQC